MANRRSGNDPHHLKHAKKILEKIVNHSRTSNLHENLFQDISKAFGLALVNVKKGDVFMEGEIGSGIFIGRLKANGINQWAGPIFLTLYGGETGFSAGISNSDYLLIFNEEKSLQKFLKENGEFKLSIDAGVETVTEEGSIGASLEGNIIKIDNKKTKKYYKKKFSIESIISGKIDPPKNADYQKIIDLLNKVIPTNITLPQNFEPRILSFENEFVDDAHNELPRKNESFSSQLSDIPTRDSATYESQESKENEDGNFKMQDQESQEPKQDLKFANEAEIMPLNLNENNLPVSSNPSNELPLPEQTISNNVLADDNFKNKISDNQYTKESTLKDTSPRDTNNAKEIGQSEGLEITDAVMETFFSIVGEANDENKAAEKYPLETAEKESFTNEEAKISVKDSSSQKNAKNIANSSSTNEPEESDHETLPTLDAKTNETQNLPYQSLLDSEPKK